MTVFSKERRAYFTIDLRTGPVGGGKPSAGTCKASVVSHTDCDL